MMILEPRAIESIALSDFSSRVCQQASAQASSASAPGSGPCLLKAQGLKKSFGGQVVLDGVDLELRQGEVILLRGENGSGKTTLLNILTGNLEPDAGAIHYLADGTPRSYRFPRHWWQELNPFDHFTPEFVAREGIGRTWQDVRLFGSQSLRDNIAVAESCHPGENPMLALLAFGRSSRREGEVNQKADAMLVRLGLAGRAASSADKISLGQSKRVAIARAVAAGAKILFLDEPLAGLDRQGIIDVLDLLESLVREQNVTLVIVEHVFNQPHLHGLVTADWLLAGGTLTVSESNSAIRNLQAIVTGRPAWFELLVSAADAEVSDEPLPRGALLTRIRRGSRFQAPLRPALEIRDLVVRRGSRTVIGLSDEGDSSGLNLIVYEGETAILQAPNGWGKSTLFAAITGHILADSGEILLEGQSLGSLSAWERARKGLRALPSHQHTFPSLRAREALQLAGNPSVSADLGLLADRICSSLSGGERQRLALSAIPRGRVGLYDEPFSALDRENTLKVNPFNSLEPTSTQLLLCPGQV